jgi:hypothetical protein
MTVDEVKLLEAQLTMFRVRVGSARVHLEQNSPVRAYKVLESLDMDLQEALKLLSGWHPSE